MYVLLLIKGSSGMWEISVNQDEHTALGECALLFRGHVSHSVTASHLLVPEDSHTGKWMRSSSTGDQALSLLLYVYRMLIRW